MCFSPWMVLLRHGTFVIFWLTLPLLLPEHIFLLIAYRFTISISLGENYPISILTTLTTFAIKSILRHALYFLLLYIICIPFLVSPQLLEDESLQKMSIHLYRRDDVKRWVLLLTGHHDCKKFAAAYDQCHCGYFEYIDLSAMKLFLYTMSLKQHIPNGDCKKACAYFNTFLSYVSAFFLLSVWSQVTASKD